MIFNHPQVRSIIQLEGTYTQQLVLEKEKKPTSVPNGRKSYTTTPHGKHVYQLLFQMTNRLSSNDPRILGKLSTLLGISISHEKSLLKMIFLFPSSDMLVPWRVIFLRNWLRQVNVVGISSVFFQVSRCFKSIGLGRTRMQYARRCSGSQGKTTTTTTTTTWWLKTVKRGTLDVFCCLENYVIRFCLLLCHWYIRWIYSTVVLMIWTFAVLMEPILAADFFDDLIRVCGFNSTGILSDCSWILQIIATSGEHIKPYGKGGESSSSIVPNDRSDRGYVILHSRAAGRVNLQGKLSNMPMEDGRLDVSPTVYEGISFSVGVLGSFRYLPRVCGKNI